MALIVQHPSIANAGKQPDKLGVGDSSFIQEIKYDSQSLQLTVTFKNGGEYAYYGVYPSEYDDFMQAKSKGKFFAERIKGKYQSANPINKNTGPSAKRKQK